MTTIPGIGDWKALGRAVLEQSEKRASTPPPANSELERAFADQAWAFQEPKMGPLMRDPYRLGFEVVYKNEPDNNRMVGAFGFRLGDGLLLAPVFFLNGQIKGTDLLYRHWVKLFNPNTREWVDHLVASSTSLEGRGVPRTPQPSSASPDLGILGGRASPGTWSTKRACEVFADMCFAADELLRTKKQATSADSSPLVKLVEEEGDWVLEAIHKVASDNPRFLDALHFSGADVRITDPEVMARAAANQEKRAATSVEVAIHLGAPSQTTPPRLVEEMLESGMAIEDNRDKKTTVRIIEDDTRELMSLSGCAQKPGVYEVTTQGGSQRKVMVLREARNCESITSNYNSPVCDSSFTPESKIVLIDVETGADKSIYPDSNTMLETLVWPAQTGSLQDYAKEKPTVGKWWRVVSTNGTLLATNTFKCEAVSSEDGLTVISGKDLWADPLSFRVNPDAEGGKLGPKLFGADARFVEVQMASNDNPHSSRSHKEPEWDEAVGPLLNLGQLLNAHQIKRASLSPQGGEYLLEIDGMDPVRMPIVKLAAFLSRDLWVAGEDVTRIVKQARASGNPVRFALQLPTPPEEIEKGAAVQPNAQTPPVQGATPQPGPSGLLARALDVPPLSSAISNGLGKVQRFVGNSAKNINISKWHWDNRPRQSPAPAAPALQKSGSFLLDDPPEWETLSDPASGIQMESPQRHVLVARRDNPESDVPRWGDGLSHEIKVTLGAGSLSNLPPELLEQAANGRGVANVFDHGAVGALVNTFNAVEVVDTYLPRLQEGLDHLGRTYFLMLWKPDDFRAAFGDDDLEAVEHELVNAFRQLGSIVLTLMQKSQKLRNGRAILPT